MGMAEDFFNKLAEMADELSLEGDEKESFVNSGMKRKGFKPRMAWDDPEDSGNGGGDFFNRRQKKQTRNVGNGGGGFFD